MFKSDKRNYLNKFLKNHQKLSSDEKKVILDTIEELNKPNSLQYREKKLKNTYFIKVWENSTDC